MNLSLIFAPLVGFFAIIFAIYLIRGLLLKSKGTAKMVDISKAIKTGAIAYLTRQFLVAGLFAVGITFALGFVLGYSVAIAFSLGAILSGLSAYIGMRVAIHMNSRTANAAFSSLNESLSVATRSGTVVGISLAGLGLLGVSSM